MIQILLGIIFLGYGVSAIIMYQDIGGIALRSGTIIYGIPAFFVAIISILFGIASLVLFFKQRKNDLSINFQVGKHSVIVRNKNTTLGAVQSLTLQLEQNQLITFYCSAERVASSLLNDFELGKNAILVIKNKNGRDCELTAKSACAHGMIRK